MTNSEALEILRKEVSCRNEPEYKCNERSCVSCKYRVEEKDLVPAMEAGVEALELIVSMEENK